MYKTSTHTGAKLERYGNTRESRAHGYIGICTHVCIMDDGDYSDFGSTGGIFFRPNRPDRPMKMRMCEANVE